MPKEERGSPQYDERTLMLFAMSKELNRRANAVFEELDALSDRLHSAVDRSRASDPRISESLGRSREEHAAEYKNASAMMKPPPDVGREMTFTRHQARGSEKRSGGSCRM